MGVRAGQNDVRVEQSPEDGLGPHVTMADLDLDAESQAPEMVCHEIDLGGWGGALQMLRSRSKNSPHVRRGVQEITVDEDKVANPHTHELFCQGRTDAPTPHHGHAQVLEYLVNVPEGIPLPDIQQ